MGVNTLLNICAGHVADYADHYLRDIRTLPVNIKDQLLQIMTSRRTVTDMNIGQLLHPEIQKLNLQHCHVSDSALRHVCCPRLRTILLRGCQRITSAGVLAVASSCPSLQVVDLDGCVLVTDEAVRALARGCGALEVLSLRECSSVGDAALLALAENCRLLHSLYISGTQVSDVGINGLVTGPYSNNLHELELAGCPNLTDESVRAVLTNCPKIKRFEFHDCPHISNWSRASLDNYFGVGKIEHVTWTVY